MKLSPMAITQIEGVGRQRRCHLFLLGCFIVASFILYFTFVVFDSRTGTTATLTDSSTVETHQQITLLLRMPGKVLEHKARYYCDLFRTTVLFWPPSYGKTVIVLDEESEMDHEFGEIVTRHTREHFPEYKLEVFFEPLPNDKSILENPGLARNPGYNRQLWSSFFFDLYTNDPIIAWMDSDVAFITPVTNSLIFSGSKLRVLGWDCSFQFSWVMEWARTSERALGLPYVADFMSYFPVYFYRDTFARCREHIMKHWNVTTFEEAFKLFYHDKNQLSPVLGRHYKAVGLEMKEDGRKVEWKNVQTVEKLAKDLGVTCKPLLY